MFLYVDSEDSDQTRRKLRLIRVIVGRAGHFVGFVVLRLNDIVSKGRKSH